MLLKASSISKTFKRGNVQFSAVKNVSIALNENSFTFIVGRSGSGKTTLLNLLSGLLKPSGGEIFFEDRNVLNMSDRDRSFYRNAGIGFVPQVLGSLPNLTVLDNVRLPFFMFKRGSDDGGRALSLLEMMGILHLKDELPCSLSGGEEKRMLIARSLMNEPKLLIADEPTSNLDSETTREVMEGIGRVHRQGVACLIVTHDESIIEEKSDVYKMENGELTSLT
ncbi:MAG: ATP-binding cassette domain-containing protein [Treponema sp.]